jgi:hypothetical protein
MSEVPLYKGAQAEADTGGVGNKKLQRHKKVSLFLSLSLSLSLSFSLFLSLFPALSLSLTKETERERERDVLGPAVACPRSGIRRDFGSYSEHESVRISGGPTHSYGIAHPRIVWIIHCVIHEFPS